MNDLEPDVLIRLSWTLRRWAWLLVLAPLAALAAALLVGPTGPLGTPPLYRSASLVAATRLEIWHEQVPRLAAAVFNSGAVADSVAAGLPETEPIEVARRLDLEPVGQTMGVWLVAFDPDPDRAALMANAGGQALVQELGKLGPGVGSFAVIQGARPAVEPEPSLSVPLLVVLALSGGLLFSLGVAGLSVLLRRPVIEPDEAAVAASAPVLGVVRLRYRRDASHPGLAALVRRLFPDGTGRWTVVGCDGDEARERLFAAVASWLSLRGPVAVVPLNRSRLWELVPDLERRSGVSVLQGRGSRPNVPVLADGGTVTDGDPLERTAVGSRLLLVVPDGIRQSRVSAAAAQLPRELLGGVVFVQRWGALRPARATVWRAPVLQPAGSEAGGAG